MRTWEPATASGLLATPMLSMAASIAVSGAGGRGGAGGAGAGAGADVSLAVDVVPVEFTESLDESMRATAFCSLLEALDVALAV